MAGFQDEDYFDGPLGLEMHKPGGRFPWPATPLAAKATLHSSAASFGVTSRGAMLDGYARARNSMTGGFAMVSNTVEPMALSNTLMDSNVLQVSAFETVEAITDNHPMPTLEFPQGLPTAPTTEQMHLFEGMLS